MHIVRSIAPIKIAALFLGVMVAVCPVMAGAQGHLTPQQHQRFMSYVNSDDSQKLLADPIVKAQLAHLMGPQLRHLLNNLNVHGPIGLEDGMLILSGNAPNMGMMENGFLGVKLYNGEAVACLFTHGRVEVFTKQPKFDYLAQAVRQWAVWILASAQLRGRQPSNIVMHTAR